MSSRVAERRRRLAVRFVVAAFVWSMGLVLAALLVPAYSGQTTSSSNGLSLSSATLVEVNGAAVLIPVALPAVLALLIGLAMRRGYSHGRDWTRAAAWIMLGLLWVLVAVSILSIGVFIIPVAVLLGLALRLMPTPGGEAQPGDAEPDGGHADPLWQSHG